ncbi:hypothetical protein ACFSAG_10965 [Sphingorhabdus buctiana]|jgi:hypothetical protein|uniref:Uncharacterized protein n=1 Tax=Sphingorhabdus buctiana TaxID=1508805 RepID=A0ABW4MEN1_9SPHN
MIQNLLESWPFALVVASTIAALSGAILTFTQFRRTVYETRINQVQLDHSRKVLEREIERLHEQIYRDGSRLTELNHLLLDSIRNKSPSLSGEHLGIDPSGSSFLKSMGIDATKISIDPNFVFVLTPLNSAQTAVYNIVQNECQKIGLRVRRGDETRIDGPILPHILKEILSSRLIVANINGRNPNVFYELGIAQTLGKPVLLVVRSYDDVPFDLKQQQLVIYNDIKELPSLFGTALSRFAFSVKS